MLFCLKFNLILQHVDAFDPNILNWWSNYTSDYKQSTPEQRSINSFWRETQNGETVTSSFHSDGFKTMNLIRVLLFNYLW